MRRGSLCRSISIMIGSMRAITSKYDSPLSCYVMLCYVMLCYVMLYYFMLYYVMLCYVRLCNIISPIAQNQLKSMYYQTSVAVHHTSSCTHVCIYTYTLAISCTQYFLSSFSSILSSLSPLLSLFFTPLLSPLLPHLFTLSSLFSSISSPLFFILVLSSLFLPGISVGEFIVFPPYEFFWKCLFYFLVRHSIARTYYQC